MSRATLIAAAALLFLILATAVSAQNEMPLTNGDFELVTELTPGADGLCQGWRLGDPPVIPSGWTLNTHYVGTLEVRTDDARSGERYVRLTGDPEVGGHIYQMRDDLEVGRWYRVSAWIRGGTASLYMYEYYQERPMSTPLVAQGQAGDEWRPIPALLAGPRTTATPLAIAVAPGQTVVDDVCAWACPTADPGGEEIVLEMASRVDAIRRRSERPAGAGQREPLAIRGAGQDVRGAARRDGRRWRR